MEKQIFKVGDRVFDIRFGWGTVKHIEKDEDSYFPVNVLFDDDKNQNSKFYTAGHSDEKYSNLLSFTEYTLQGFSQERLVNYEEYIGKWGVFWDRRCNGYYISKLKEIDVNNGFTEFVDSDSGKWDKFRPLMEEQIKILKSCD